jgi:hypothetical protein
MMFMLFFMAGTCLSGLHFVEANIFQAQEENIVRDGGDGVFYRSNHTIAAVKYYSDCPLTVPSEEVGARYVKNLLLGYVTCAAQRWRNITKENRRELDSSNMVEWNDYENDTSPDNRELYYYCDGYSTDYYHCMAEKAIIDQCRAACRCNDGLRSGLLPTGACYARPFWCVQKGYCRQPRRLGATQTQRRLAFDVVVDQLMEAFVNEDGLKKITFPPDVHLLLWECACGVVIENTRKWYESGTFPYYNESVPHELCACPNKTVHFFSDYDQPTLPPTKAPTKSPASTMGPTRRPTNRPTHLPTVSMAPTGTKSPTASMIPTTSPTVIPTTMIPTIIPTTMIPTIIPTTMIPTMIPTTMIPTLSPTK